MSKKCSNSIQKNMSYNDNFKGYKMQTKPPPITNNSFPLKEQQVTQPSILSSKKAISFKKLVSHSLTDHTETIETAYSLELSSKKFIFPRHSNNKIMCRKIKKFFSLFYNFLIFLFKILKTIL